MMVEAVVFGKSHRSSNCSGRGAAPFNPEGGGSAEAAGSVVPEIEFILMLIDMADLPSRLSMKPLEVSRSDHDAPRWPSVAEIRLARNEWRNRTIVLRRCCRFRRCDHPNWRRANHRNLIDSITRGRKPFPC